MNPEVEAANTVHCTAWQHRRPHSEYVHC